MTAGSEPLISKNRPTESTRKRPLDAQTRPSELANKNRSDQLLLTNKFITHHPKSGLNPLVDAAAYLFSIVGKLKQLKSYRHLNKLQKELILEINQFQETAKSQGYSSEYILVSRYAICATLDDIIANTLWGGQGQWDNFCMLAVFNQDAMNHDRFFVILERIIKDPEQYIDVMELMYICLSLGFKGTYRTTEFGNSQLEQIIHSLYKRIRLYHGDFNKSLAPFSIKPARHSKPKKRIPLWSIGLSTGVVVLIIFIGLGSMVDSFSNQAYRELMHIGNSLLYETAQT